MYYTNEIARIAPVSAKTGLFARIMQMSALAKERRALAKLTDTHLTDIGVTRVQAEKEANRPAWNAPNHWQK